ncbi:MAG TPA: tetratricopeptide repeat protein [Kofleriaceae bacterium]
MRGLWVVAVLVGLSSAYADPAKPRPAVRAWQAKRVTPRVVPAVAVVDVHASPKRVYQAAQAHRMKGDRAKAIELYEKYLQLSPKGPAANACRAELEKLRDVP